MYGASSMLIRPTRALAICTDEPVSAPSRKNRPADRAWSCLIVLPCLPFPCLRYFDAEGLVLGEEFGRQGNGRHGSGSRRWIVDPIDGTANFAAGRAEWSTLLAVEEDGEIVTGMISAPMLRRRWLATRSAGAWTSSST